MSWAEDNGIDIYDLTDELVHDFEAEWREGTHTTRDHRTIPLREMETSHIENTIKYFSKLDTTPLELELVRRERIERLLEKKV